ncbi:MAG: M1 family metallopeptidase [Deltaproteobacteria bacterium]|nr:M1 family metallopeptidase [Deltaproteobacteria bacterium]
MLLDPHSYNDTAQPETTHVHWKARVDFAARTIEAEATLTLSEPGSGPLDLDTRDLTILGASDQNGTALEFTLHPAEPILGSRLRIMLPRGTSKVSVKYKTSPDASALQWLTPAQTHSGKHPFLFSQCQAVHARSVIPLQDTPRLRVTFRAEMTVPKNLTALFAAAFVSRTVSGDEATVVYDMPQPIPPYLLALAVGELESRDIGPRSRVWAEPGVIEAAAWEFGGVESMIQSAEKLFGPYEWDRFDVLTMPPSFPYGGMENPRLTFLTPTVLAGDRSLVNLLAHELAHSWTGNLVTNANADHFWLNEGFTVYAERRIFEALQGAEMAALHAAMGRRRLERAIDKFADRPELTKLRCNLKGVDPDDAFSDVPYEKGYLFLRTLEEEVGRPAFDKFLLKYVATWRFKSITTEQFLEFLEQNLPGVAAKVHSDDWIHKPGIPAGASAPRSTRLDAVRNLGASVPSDETAVAWTPTEWVLYLDNLPRPTPRSVCEKLESSFHLTGSHNHEVLVAWLAVATASGFDAALPRVERILGEVGRMKYLEPLYSALAKSSRYHSLAQSCYDKAKDSYHPIARQVVEGVLRRNAAVRSDAVS